MLYENLHLFLCGDLCLAFSFEIMPVMTLSVKQTLELILVDMAFLTLLFLIHG
jgi:hypothetical protein